MLRRQPPERNKRGEYLLWRTESDANRLAALRRRGESCSDAVIRLAKAAQDEAPEPMPERGD
jgi:hypothetical protein